MNKIISDLLRLPNLVSLSRVFLAPIIVLFVVQDSFSASLVALGLFILAGITDGLDGYFARRMGLVSGLGMVLDPLADKVLAAVMVVVLVIYREFPLWLAGLIVGRDLVILLAAAVLLKGKAMVVSSSITGKYAFASMAVLIACYIIRLEDGIELMLPLSVGLIVFSLIGYARVYVVRSGGKSPSESKPGLVAKQLRLVSTGAVSGYILWKFIAFLIDSI